MRQLKVPDNIPYLIRKGSFTHQVIANRNGLPHIGAVETLLVIELRHIRTIPEMMLMRYFRQEIPVSKMGVTYRVHLQVTFIIMMTDGSPSDTMLASSGIQQRRFARTAATGDGPMFAFRSEEHTSELQSLMRISYAVICLNIKIQHNPITD